MYITGVRIRTAVLTIDDWDALHSGQEIRIPESAQYVGLSPELREHLIETGELESEPEAESQASKHCDSGYMNDMRFGDGPD